MEKTFQISIYANFEKKITLSDIGISENEWENMSSSEQELAIKEYILEYVAWTYEEI